MSNAMTNGQVTGSSSGATSHCWHQSVVAQNNFGSNCTITKGASLFSILLRRTLPLCFEGFLLIIRPKVYSMLVSGCNGYCHR